jgi:predicted fused transcriptional regulator/phosphomethylpyrimidine kinase
MSDENNKIVNNLTEAFLLLKGKNISGLIPEIKINIAMAKKDANSSDDIAAFLNGLIIADEKVTGYNGIRFGKSKHLSSLLLDLKEKIDINAIMNIAYVKNLENTGFIIDNLTKDFKLGNDLKKVDILLHKGDFGIEPCAYVLGNDAIDVVNKVVKIKEEI